MVPLTGALETGGSGEGGTGEGDEVVEVEAVTGDTAVVVELGGGSRILEDICWIDRQQSGAKV